MGKAWIPRKGTRWRFYGWRRSWRKNRCGWHLRADATDLAPFRCEMERGHPGSHFHVAENLTIAWTPPKRKS